MLIGRIVSIIDELFVIFLFIYTFFARSIRLGFISKFSITGFCICGILSNFFQGTNAYVAVWGMFNTLKPIILYICFIQYSFTWEDFYGFLKKFNALFPIIAIAFIMDMLTPSFRDFIGIGGLEYRAGIRTLGGLFVKQTNSSLWALIYYIFHKYYSPLSTWNKYKSTLSLMMILLTLKVKDILGLITAQSLLLFKKINVSYFVIGVPIIYIAFGVYMTFMPDHYAEYFDNEGDNSSAARVVLSYTSAHIANDYMPLGVGFGQFASPVSRDYDSPVYGKYGIDKVWGLSNEEGAENFMCDTFWPMILGETGYLGLLFYIIFMYCSFEFFMKKFFKNTHDPTVLFPAFIFIVFLIASIGKPVFSGPPHSFVVWGIAGIFHSLCKKEYVQIHI